MESMLKIKIFFGLMIFLLLFLVAIGSYYDDERNFNIWNSIENVSRFGIFEKSLIAYDLNSENCIFEEQNRTIILRMDDIAAWQYKNTVKKLFSDILDRNMAVSLGVIPDNLGRDKNIVYWLDSIKKDPRVEIALHGFNHEPNEFINLSKEEAGLRIEKGKKEIVDTLGVIPITFIPPYNEYSNGTIEALSEYGFKIFSAKENEFQTGKDLVYLGYNGRTYDFFESYFVPIENVINDCKKSLEEKGLCIVMLHPQDYIIESEDRDTIDEGRYNEFIKLLDELNELNAEFKTFKDTLRCSEI